MKVIVVGAGIGGLTAALRLHAAGIDCAIYEKSSVVQELGVGINLLPHATAELADLGLLEQLLRTGIETYALHYVHHLGPRVLTRPCGRNAGARTPQVSIHRGRLQQLLLRTVRDRMGTPRIHTAHRMTGFTQDASGVQATFDGPDGSTTVEGDVLVAADGIHSTARSQLVPQEGPPRFSGVTLWRGASDWPTYDGGRTMLVAGDTSELGLVVYPIADGAAHGTRLTNWALCVRTGRDGEPAPIAEDWSKVALRDRFLPEHVDWFNLDTFGLDHRGLIAATERIYVFPMCDRDPLSFAAQGRVALLGDAFHPFRPMGSQGAAQAILDATTLAWALAHMADPRDALIHYQQNRVPRTSQLLMANRVGGPERVVREAQDRYPDGFDRLDPQFEADMHALVDNYQRAATSA